MVVHGEGFHFCCNVVDIREEETQEESSSDIGAVELWIWLLCAQTARSRCRVEEKNKEHDNHKSNSSRHILRSVCVKTYLKISLHPADCKVLHSFLMPDEEHLGGFSQMGFHVISCVE